MRKVLAACSIQWSTESKWRFTGPVGTKAAIIVNYERPYLVIVGSH